MKLKDLDKDFLENGVFKQFVISPYSGGASNFNKVIIISDNVSEVDYLTHRKQKLALIIPFNNKSLVTSLEDHSSQITNFIGVDATYFSVFNVNDNYLKNTLFIFNNSRKDIAS